MVSGPGKRRVHDHQIRGPVREDDSFGVVVFVGGQDLYLSRIQPTGLFEGVSEQFQRPDADVGSAAAVALLRLPVIASGILNAPIGGSVYPRFGVALLGVRRRQRRAGEMGGRGHDVHPNQYLLHHGPVQFRVVQAGPARSGCDPVVGRGQQSPGPARQIGDLQRLDPLPV